jgi:hypothetical protein
MKTRKKQMRKEKEQQYQRRNGSQGTLPSDSVMFVKQSRRTWSHAATVAHTVQGATLSPSKLAKTKSVNKNVQNSGTEMIKTMRMNKDMESAPIV